MCCVQSRRQGTVIGGHLYFYVVSAAAKIMFSCEVWFGCVYFAFSGGSGQGAVTRLRGMACECPPPLGVGPGCVQLKIAQGGKNEKVPCQHNRGTGNVLNDPAVLKEKEGKRWREPGEECFD